MPEETKITREYRIEMAKRYAPQNAVQEREGLAIGELVTVNADMIKLLQEDMEAWKAKAESLERLAREVAGVWPDFRDRPDDDGVDYRIRRSLLSLAAHFAEQDKERKSE